MSKTNAQIGKEYVSQGCWKDLPWFWVFIKIDNDIDESFGKTFKDRHDPIQNCLDAALGRGYILFALQKGGECWGTDDRNIDYKKYGQTDECKLHGLGGPKINHVYEIKTGKLLILK